MTMTQSYNIQDIESCIENCIKKCRMDWLFDGYQDSELRMYFAWLLGVEEILGVPAIPATHLCEPYELRDALARAHVVGGATRQLAITLATALARALGSKDQERLTRRILGAAEIKEDGPLGRRLCGLPRDGTRTSDGVANERKLDEAVDKARRIIRHILDEGGNDREKWFRVYGSITLVPELNTSKLLTDLGVQYQVEVIKAPAIEVIYPTAMATDRHSVYEVPTTIRWDVKARSADAARDHVLRKYIRESYNFLVSVRSTRGSQWATLPEAKESL